MLGCMSRWWSWSQSDRRSVQYLVDLSERVIALRLEAEAQQSVCARLEAAAWTRAVPHDEGMALRQEDTQAIFDANDSIRRLEEDLDRLEQSLSRLSAAVLPALQVRAAHATTRATWALVFFTAALIAATVVAAVIVRA